jgi:putative tryptophan/tyrosine transport system substrate-binding protein
MERRRLIVLAGGAVVWTFSARAQQGDVRRISALMHYAESDPDAQARIAGLLRGLRERGWVSGRNAEIIIHWTGGDPDFLQREVAGSVAAAPHVIFAAGSPAVGLLQRATQTIPVVFVGVVDPVNAGFVVSMARPGGNVTGFVQFEYSVSGKWLEILKEIAPGTTRVAVIWDPTIAAGGGQLRAIQSAAPSFGVEISPVDVRDANEIRRALATFAQQSNGGLVVTGGSLALVHRELILTLAAEHRLPAVYFTRSFIPDGGLISYGVDLVEHFRSAAAYIDRILRGEQPLDLPVQAPTKYELVLNLKTARTMGFAVPATLLARADEVVE